MSSESTPPTSEKPELAPVEDPALSPSPRKSKAGSGLFFSISEVFSSLRSSDRQTRNGSILFLFSLFGIVFLLGLSGYYFIEGRRDHSEQSIDPEDTGKNLGDFIKKRAEEAKRKYSNQSLGTFTIELKTAVDHSRQAPGVMNIAEIEIQVQCDEKETCTTIEDNLARVRDEVTAVFTAMDRDELVTKEGKKQLKKKILDRINAWLVKGKIDELYFTKLIIN